MALGALPGTIRLQKNKAERLALMRSFESNPPKPINILSVMRYTFAFILFFGALSSQAQNVLSAQYANQADVAVFVVDYENQCDLKVFKVDYANQAKGNEGLWYFVDYANQADHKIFFAEYGNQSDLKIFFVPYKNQAGWRNKSKQHLLY
jgi:hypothetical protein